MTTPLTLQMIGQAPKALLHDHLDGGLRPSTVLDIAGQIGYDELPATDEAGLANWFRTAAHSGSLVRYLEPFAHTVAVMQSPEALHRVAFECVEDLAADNVVYAEVRFAPELHLTGGLSLRKHTRCPRRPSAMPISVATTPLPPKVEKQAIPMRKLDRETIMLPNPGCRWRKRRPFAICPSPSA